MGSTQVQFLSSLCQVQGTSLSWFPGWMQLLPVPWLSSVLASPAVPQDAAERGLVLLCTHSPAACASHSPAGAEWL